MGIETIASADVAATDSTSAGAAATALDDAAVAQLIDRYLDEHWEDIVADITALVRIPSTEDLSAADAAAGAPFGPGPRAALDAALALAERMGFATHDVDGYLGYADWQGETDTQLGVIGHVDVVPAGPGWTVEPFDVTRREGYLLGRGVIDDKGPLVVAMHAVKLWKDAGAQFPYTVRLLFGANEESGMDDVRYYRERYADPAFLITPDAEFPVCYGEKGLFDATLTSAPLDDGVICDISGGAATNAVPGCAEALVRANAAALPAAPGIAVEDAGGGLARIAATGKSAHASQPDLGVSAIGLLVHYLLDNSLCSEGERAFLELDCQLLDHTDGSGLGIACEDEHFGALTVVGGTIAYEGGRIMQTLDSRFPTAITSDELTAKLEAAAAGAGATVEVTRREAPFLMQPDAPHIRALLDAYNQATGEAAEPFTMGGGTYARKFSKAASFGPEMPWVETPDWVGSMHGPDEGVSEELLKKAFRIYALTLPKLMELEL